MYILEQTQNDDLGDVFRMSDGRSVFVNQHTVGFLGGHPSNVDYYYSEGGYNCKTAREVAIVFATQFPQ